MTVRLGTSGWHYSHWQKTFYPKDLPKSEWLSYYLECFNTVEINNSFYQLPSRETLEKWRDGVPDGFEFTAKASQYITHRKKLKDPDRTLSNFFDRMEVLGDKLNVILFQLPPRWSFNGERLEAFLDALPDRYRYTFELRDESWICDRAIELLSQQGSAFCIYEFAGRQSPPQLTTDWTYLRLHGMYDEPYRGEYEDARLDKWARQFAEWSQTGKTIYCYFDNDEAGYAPHDALRLADKLRSLDVPLASG